MSGIQTVTVVEQVIGSADNVISETTSTVVVNLGVAGPRGDVGPQGPVATPVAYDLVEVSMWTNTHTFPYNPWVQVLSATGTQMYVSAEYPDATHVAITFPDPFTGTVILR